MSPTVPLEPGVEGVGPRRPRGSHGGQPPLQCPARPAKMLTRTAPAALFII